MNNGQSSDPADARTALHQLDTHEKVCTERYGNIWKALNDLKSDVAGVQNSVQQANTQHHDRFNVMSGRMWALLAWVAGTSIIGLGSLAFYFMTKGH